MMVSCSKHEVESETEADEIVEIEVDVGESSLEEGIYEPVQRILDLVRSVKVPSL